MYQFVVRLFLRIAMIALWIILILIALQFGSYFKGKFAEKSINILVWPQVLDGEFLKDFEQKTGVKVYISYFDHNEELLVKLEASHNHGYDLIMPSHYMLQELVEKNLIKPINKELLSFWNHIYPTLLGTYADPHNNYSVPFYWGILGIGINRHFFPQVDIKPSWDLIFKQHSSVQCVSVINDIRELSLIAAQYLFGRIRDLSDSDIDKIIELLVTQKKQVGLYTDGRAEYAIAANSCPVGVVLLNDLLKVMTKFDYIDFVIPEEGTFVVVDSFVMAKQTKKDELIYQFLNYLYDPIVLKKYTAKFQFLSASDTVEPAFEEQKRFIPTKTLFNKLHFFENVFSEETLHKIWLAVRVH
jgi:spermidine/putrescine transport system substrate-binding protein